MTLEEILRSVVDLELFLDWETVRAGFGFHKSRKIGSGVRFLGVKPEYIWPRGRVNERVSERMGETYVNVWLTNRNVQVFLLADLSSSLEFGSNALKRERVARLAASISYSCFRARDPFTLVGFTDRVEPSVLVTPELQAKDLPVQVASALLDFSAIRLGAKGFGEALEYLPEGEPALVFIASDFFPKEAFVPHLAGIADIHDVVPLVFRDRWESALPPASGFAAFVDLETGEEFLVRLGDCTSEELGRRIAEENRTLLAEFRRIGMESIWCVSGIDERIAVSEFFARRLET